MSETYGIKNIAEREEAARLLTAVGDAREAHKFGGRSKECSAKMRELKAKYEAERDALLVSEKALPPEQLYADVETAQKAYDAHPLAILETNRGYPIRCAKSGIPLIDGDETVSDDDDGDETYLRAALGLPPRPIDPDDEV